MYYTEYDQGLHNPNNENIYYLMLACNMTELDFISKQSSEGTPLEDSITLYNNYFRMVDTSYDLNTDKMYYQINYSAIGIVKYTADALEGYPIDRIDKFRFIDGINMSIRARKDY